jgi:hypothetical protein
MRCQGHCMHEIFLLGNPFKLIYFCSGGEGQFACIQVFDRFHLNAARAARIVPRHRMHIENFE